MATINITDREIIKVLRPYFMELLGAENNQVIAGLQNGSPLPENAVVLFPIHEQDLDKGVDYFDKESGEAFVLNSVKMRLQVDLYGSDAHMRARKIANVWRDMYTTERFSVLQPLYADGVRFMQFINEKSQFEKRYTIELYLQYNTVVTYDIDYVTEFELSLFNL